MIESESQECGPAGGAARSVLLADDDPVLRVAVSRLLTSMGHHVVAVSDGLEALRALEKSRYDVVLLDVQMPRMGGIEAAGRIAGRRARPSRVVAITGDAGDPALSRATGLDSVLAKPVRASELARLIGEAPEDRPLLSRRP